MSRSPWSWMGVVCDGERSRQAVHSWFAPMVPDDWGLPIGAEIQEHMDTGREGNIRALYRRPDGVLKEALIRRQAKGRTYVLRDANPAFLTSLNYRPTTGSEPVGKLARSDAPALAFSPGNSSKTLTEGK